MKQKYFEKNIIFLKLISRIIFSDNKISNETFFQRVEFFFRH